MPTEDQIREIVKKYIKEEPEEAARNISMEAFSLVHSEMGLPKKQSIELGKLEKLHLGALGGSNKQKAAGGLLVSEILELLAEYEKIVSRIVSRIEADPKIGEILGISMEDAYFYYLQLQELKAKLELRKGNEYMKVPENFFSDIKLFSNFGVKLLLNDAEFREYKAEISKINKTIKPLLESALAKKVSSIRASQ